MREANEPRDNPFIGVRIQGATTTAQVSSSPVERPYFSLTPRSVIDCCDGPPGAVGLIDIGVARHRSSSLLYSPRIQDKLIHPGPIFFVSDPRDESAHWFFHCEDCRVPSCHCFYAIFEGP